MAVEGSGGIGNEFRLEAIVDAHLVALKLVFDGVGADVSVDDFDSRKLLQKVVYLVQRSGLDLSYRFAWDDKGPYCGELSVDNRELAKSLGLGDESWKGSRLQDKYAPSVAAVREMLDAKPTEPDLASHDWMELLASLDYLVAVNGLSTEEAEAVLGETKSHLMHDFHAARETLCATRLLPA
jgi:uncharacterized protein YwgA